MSEKKKEVGEKKDEKDEESVEEKEEEVEEREECKKEEGEEKVEVKSKEVRGGEVPSWKPKTDLGRKVMSGEITSIDELLKSGKRIIEPEIVDVLVPDLKSELILVGGRTGKGGGIQRIPIKITAVMKRSGRRFKAKAFAVVGNEDGLAGIGKGSAVEGRDAIQKAIERAKLNLIRVRRGCGSWECECGEEHSIPYKTEGRSGSVRVVLIPAPKGLGLVADDESKKLLKLAGIQDIWIKSHGNTRMRVNLITAVFNALKNLYKYER